jgi:hypothetical protein
MGRGKAPIDRLEATESGYSQGDLMSILEHYGYEFVRNARHGAVYKHPDLLSHSDENVRRELARVMIPVGKDLPRYAAREVRKSIVALLDYQKGKGNE